LKPGRQKLAFRLACETEKTNEMRAFPVAGKPLRIIDDNPPLSAQEKATGWRFFC